MAAQLPAITGPSEVKTMSNRPPALCPQTSRTSADTHQGAAASQPRPSSGGSRGPRHMHPEGDDLIATRSQRNQVSDLCVGAVRMQRHRACGA